MMKKYKFTLITTTVVMILLLMPTDNMSFKNEFIWGSLIGLDKLVHACIFGFLASIFSYERRINKKDIFINILILFAFAVLTEFLQKLTGYRSFDVMDILADTIGITIGTIMPFILKKFKR